MTRYPEVLVKSLLAIVLALFAPLAFAQTFSPTWSWPAVTGCTNGDKVGATAACTLTKYTLYTGLQGQPKKAWGTVTPDKTSVTTPNTPPGVWCGQVSASTATGESGLPTEACITLAAPVIPVAPGGLTVTLVTTSTIAYGLAPAHDRLAFLIVGSVPLGAPCLPDQTANLYRVVPVASVTFTAPYKAATVPTVFALCGA